MWAYFVEVRSGINRIGQGDKAMLFRAGVLVMHILPGLGFPVGDNDVGDQCKRKEGIKYEEWERTGCLGYLLDALGEFPVSEYELPCIPGEFLENHVLKFGATLFLTRVLSDESATMRRVLFKGVDSTKANGDEGQGASKSLVSSVDAFTKEVNKSMTKGGNAKHLPVYALHCAFDGDVMGRLDFLCLNVVGDRSDTMQKVTMIGAWKSFWGNARRGGDMIGGLLDKVFACTSPGNLINTLCAVAGLLESCLGGESVAEVIIDRLLMEYKGDSDDGLFSNSDVANTRILVAATAACRLYNTDVKRLDACIGLLKNSILEPEYARLI